VKPCLLDCAKIVLDDRTCNKLKQVSPSRDTIKSRIVEMSSDTAIISSALPFAIQLHKSTDVVNLSQLLAYIRYVSGPSIKEDFLFCQTFFVNFFIFFLLFCW